MTYRFRQLRCSFCRKTENQVRKLVAGRKRVFICDGCVAEAQRVMIGSGSAPATADKARNPLIHRIRGWLRRWYGIFAWPDGNPGNHISSSPPLVP